jgi:hypothetical protein
MIWLAWRQFRTQVLAVAGLLVVLAIALAINGTHLVHLYDTTVANCAQHNDCLSARALFQAQAKWHSALNLLMLAVPALLGAFWGAPLVARELETRTNQLAWTQGVTRSRWSLVKVAVTGAASAITAGLLSIMVTWWASPHDRLVDSPYSLFDQRDIVPIAYALFAFALGVALGAIIRRTLPAMAVTIAGYAIVRYLVSEYVRPNLIAPLKASLPFELQLTATGVGATIEPPQPNALVVSNRIATGTGKLVGENWENLGGFNLKGNGTAVFVGVGRCPNRIPMSTGPHPHAIPATQAALQRCIDSFHLRQVITYQPASRYWPLQWSEAAIFVGGAVALIALSLWWVRKRIA